MTKPKTVLVVPDVHFPWPHKSALRELKRTVIPALKPTHIVQLGDLLDLYGLSKFSKDPTRGLTLKQEVALGREFVSEMQDSCGFYLQCEGNHSARLSKRLQDEPDLSSTHPSLRELLGVPEKNWCAYHTHYAIGRVLFTHDVGYAGAHAAQQTLMAMQACCVFGHTHRASIVYGGDLKNDRYVCMNPGWLGDASACDYLPEAKKRDWQVACGVVDYSPSGHVHMQILPFVNGRFLGT